MRNIVDRLDLRRALADENTLQKLKVAGFRGQNPLTRFLFFRLVLPFVGFALALVYIFVLGGLPDKPLVVRLFVCVLVAYGGFYTPVLYVNNRATKRKQSIQMAWPDALDLMLICVESGMSVEAALRKVADEIGAQSVALAEEFILTNAELSYLQDRRQARYVVRREGGRVEPLAAPPLLVQPRDDRGAGRAADRRCHVRIGAGHALGGEAVEGRSVYVGVQSEAAAVGVPVVVGNDQQNVRSRLWGRQGLNLSWRQPCGRPGRTSLVRRSRLGPVAVVARRPGAAPELCRRRGRSARVGRRRG